ncbi:MAG TPA: fused MFS/spermidine synthase, partial [Fibrobacteria bacterium]|nr:fused MFS/spermidine synthase [Fibrobacteria bacterium]
MHDPLKARRASQAPLYTLLVLSGSTSLVYELLWTRILSFSFGSTSLAFAAVLAVFFLGLAGGSVLGGKAARRLRFPLRAYAVLELSIGLYAAAAFPLLFHLHRLFSLHNAGGAEPSGVAFRFAAAAAVLAVPTLCMGATFPVLLEHLHRSRSHLAEALGRLYGVNTLGAFLGVYAATHWLIPYLGLDRANYVAVAVNVLVFAAAWLAGPQVPAKAAGPAPGPRVPGAPELPYRKRYSAAGLILLAASGFTALGYEVVWGRVLTIALEGSLYGIGTTLGSFLAGIGLGGLLFSLLARRLSDPGRLFRAYVAACLAMVAYLALSRLLLPLEGYLLKSVHASMRGLAGLHLNFALGIIFLLPVTAALGFMFPAAVALHGYGRRDPAEGAGKAYALNTCMSVFGSLASASFLMDRLGIEGVVYLGVLVMLGTLVIAVWMVLPQGRARLAGLAVTGLPLLLAAGAWPAIDARTVLIGHVDGRPPSLAGLFQNLAAHFAPTSHFKVYKDGVGTTLTVTQTGRVAGIQSNGLPQSGRSLDPPHFNFESTLVGLFPALHHPEGKDALVIGLGAGITVGVLRQAGIPRVEVVELEPGMPALCRSIYPEKESPLDDTGVTLRLDDARNFLVRNGYRAAPRRWDIIASQPAHPWVTGAADLFTEEMFRLAYANLAEGGVFCQWFMDGGIDARGFAALAAAFGHVFDDAILYRSQGSLNGLFFVGTRGKRPLSLATVERLFDRPRLRRLLELNEHPRPADVFQYALTGLGDARRLAAAGVPVNRDRNAYVESRMPLIPKSAFLRPADLEA